MSEKRRVQNFNRKTEREYMMKNIKMGSKETRFETIVLIHLPQDREKNMDSCGR